MRRLIEGVARRFVVFMAVVPMFVVLLVTAPGTRLALRETKQATTSVTLRAIAAQVQSDRKGCGDRRAAVDNAASDSSDDGTGGTTDADDSEESQANEPENDQDDSDDGDEMIVLTIDQLPGASLVALLWHETPKLSGVIHTPEPRPARRA
ncbi:MAG: hypothetical protein ABW133_24550 [Polyangiaceae bacterium]